MTRHPPGPCPLCGGPVVVQTSVHAPAGEVRAGLAVDAVGSVVVPGERAPLSTWVRACEVSKLGAPRWRMDEDSRDHIVAAFADHDVTVELSLRYDNSGAQPYKGGEYMGFTCATPADLAAALDRLVSEVPR